MAMIIVLFSTQHWSYTIIWDSIEYSPEEVEKIIYTMYRNIIIYIPLIILILSLFERLIAYRFYYWIYVNETGAFAFKHMKGTTSIFAKRGGFKDTLMAALSVMLARLMRIKMRIKLIKIKKKLYIFNLYNTIDLLKSDHRMFADASEEYRKENFKLFIKKNEKEVFKQFYLNVKKISYENLMLDYELYRQDYLDAKYTYFNGIKNYHYFDYLYELCYVYYRLYVVKRLTMSNHPMKDDLDQTTFIYSDKNTHLNIKEQRNPENKKDKAYYKAKQQHLLEDNMIVVLTEMDIIAGNYKPEVVALIKQLGTRDWEAFRRHDTGEDFFMFKNGQVEGRGAKVLREMDDWILKIVSAEKIEGGRNIVPVLQFIEKIYEKKIKKKDIYKKIRKLQERKNILEYDILLLEDDSIDIINTKEYQKHKRELEKLSKIIDNYYSIDYQNMLHALFVKYEKIQSSIEKNQNNGWFKLNVQLKTSIYSGDLPDLKISKVLKDSTKLLDGFTTTFVIRIMDSWTKYNTTYLKSAGEDKRKESEIALIDNAVYGPNLEISVNEVLEMNNPVMNSIFGITFKQLVENGNFYKVDKNTKKENENENENDSDDTEPKENKKKKSGRFAPIVIENENEEK